MQNSVTTLQNKPLSWLKIAKYESISTKKRLIRPKWKKQHKCGYNQFNYWSQLLVTLNNYISNKQGTLSWEPSRARNWDEFSLPRTLSVCFLRCEATLTHLKFKLVLSLNNNMTAIWNVVTVIIYGRFRKLTLTSPRKEFSKTLSNSVLHNWYRWSGKLSVLEVMCNGRWL